jgi:hypothetical protein
MPDIRHTSTGRGNAGPCVLPDGTTLLVDIGELPGKTAQHTPDRPVGTLPAGEWVVRSIRHALASVPLWRGRQRCLPVERDTHAEGRVPLVVLQQALAVASEVLGKRVNG